MNNPHLLASLAFAGLFSFQAVTHGAIISFQNDGIYTGADDITMVSGASSANNFGSHAGIDAGAFGADFFPADPHVVRGLVRFDVSALAGQFAAINSVTLRLNVLAVLGANTVEVFEPVAVNGSWVEGTGDDTFQAGTSTWDNKIQPGTAWVGGAGLGTLGYGGMLAGNSYTGGFSGTSDFVISNPATATSLIANFLGGSNGGFFLKATNEATTASNVVIFTSSEVATVSQRPRLIVDYTPTPEPSIAMLFAAGTLFLMGSRKPRS